MITYRDSVTDGYIKATSPTQKGKLGMLHIIKKTKSSEFLNFE